MNSYLCDLIRENPNTWETICEEKNIRVKRDATLPYVIFNYIINADFTDPVVKEARGIIIDIEKLEVVCWPFNKFGNSHESYADTIDWRTARVQEKIDGSIQKLWFSKRLGVWVWSTNSCIFATEAKAASGRTFQAIIESTPEYALLKEGLLNRLTKAYTYIFELVSPDNQVVIRYPDARLWHIGTRNNTTGDEYDLFIDIQRPKEYPLHSLAACKKAAMELNKNDFPDAEGFVVVDKNWHRVKIKSPEYLLWHHAVSNDGFNKETAYDLFRSDDFSWDVFSSNVSEYVLKKAKFYSQAIVQALDAVEYVVDRTRALQSQGLSRKDIALQIKDLPGAAFGFKALSNDLDVNGLIELMGVNSFLKLVPEYVED